MLAETTVNRGHVSHGDPSKNQVRFYKFRYKGKMEDFVEIISPGDSRSEMRRRVQEHDKTDYPAHWKAFQKGIELRAEGYPLENWIEIDPAMLRELNHSHLYTVESIANLSDANIANLGMGMRELNKKALAFVSINDKTKDAVHYAGLYEKSKERIEFLEKDNESLKERLNVLEETLNPELKKNKKLVLNKR